VWKESELKWGDPIGGVLREVVSEVLVEED
jgi:hypothetical protein